MRRTVALAVVAATVLLGCGRSARTVGANDWDLHAVSHDGRTLVVSTFFGGVASDGTRFERWEIGESDDEVEVALVGDRLVSVATATSVLAVDLATGEERWATIHLEADTPTEASDAP